MKQHFLKLTPKFILAFLIVAMVITSVPMPVKTANAVVFFDPANFGENFITALSTVGSNIVDYFMEYKESVLDPLAWMIAKQLLQSMTGDIVSWINSGFEGSPAFLSNPGGFFLDAADQVTGAMLLGSDLSALCSPFSLDIRLSLALGQANRLRQRYTCTLGQIINNVKSGGVRVNAGIDVRTVDNRSIRPGVNINDRDIDTFMDDFSQGGWPAFTALTMEPQNNIYGAYLTSYADLQHRILTRQDQIKFDLQLGSGFMSWQKCKEVFAYHEDDSEMALTAHTMVEAGASTKYKSGKDGVIHVEQCKTETPGSVISGTLNKQLGAPVDQLNLADELDEIISAAFSQLVIQILNGGLLSESDRSNKESAVSKLTRLSKRDAQILNRTRKQMDEFASKYASSTAEYKSIRNFAFNLISAEKLALDATLACMVQQSNSGNATTSWTTMIDQVRKYLEETVLPKYREYEKVSLEADAKYDTIQTIRRAVDETEFVEDMLSGSTTVQLLKIREASSEFESLQHRQAVVTVKDLKDARQDLRRLVNQVTGESQPITADENSGEVSEQLNLNYSSTVGIHAQVLKYQAMCSTSTTTTTQ